jgi:hypothetical protein
MKILAFDPGGTTGWATWTDASGYGEWGQIGPESHHGALWTFLTVCRVDVIVCESFQLFKANDAAELISLEYEGIVKAFAEVSQTRIVMQGSAAKRWAHNGKLQRIGIHHPWEERHTADAKRHILYFLAHNLYVPLAMRTATLRSLGPV